MAGIYIHIPYCQRKCAYCDFVSYADQSTLGAYVDAVKSEAELYSQMLAWKRFDTVFIGGGTPSILPAESIAAILDAVRRSFNVAESAEITIECNPCSITDEKLAAYYDCSINRISVGMQSDDDAVLKAIGRLHTKAVFEQAMNSIAKSSIVNRNVDIMYGLPLQTTGGFIRTLKYAVSLPINHISAYSLILEEGTPLFDRLNSDQTELPSEDDCADMEEECHRILCDVGFTRYEVSNYAKPGYQCRHNLNYWDNGEYIGLGVAAHSAIRAEKQWTRFSNFTDVKAYIDRVTMGIVPCKNVMTIDKREEMFESIMLGLRKTDGIRMDDFSKRFGVDIMDEYREVIAKFVYDKLLYCRENKLFCSPRGMSVLNIITEAFYEHMTATEP